MGCAFRGCIILVFYLTCSIDSIVGHGMLMDPVNRASLWRFDPTAPKDYDDNQGFCGGQTVQWEVNGGRCGICGDDYRDPVPRAHENTGKYGQGKIVANYTKGQIVPVSVLLTTNHRGWFQFSICRLETKKTLEQENCFRNLTLSDGSEVYKIQTVDPGSFNIEVQLPADLTCDQCVLRWFYNTATTWGPCPDGTFADGCGPQETFHSCSDVGIF